MVQWEIGIVLLTVDCLSDVDVNLSLISQGEDSIIYP